MGSLIINSKKDYEEIAYAALMDYKEKDYQSALPKLLELEKSNCNNLLVHEMLFYSYLKLGIQKKAHAQYQIYLKLLQEQNKNVPEQKSFDDLVQEAGDFKDRLKEYEAMMEKPEQYDILEALDVLSNLNVLYMSRGEYDKAKSISNRFREAFMDILKGGLTETSAA